VSTGFTTKLATGLAELLATSGVGEWAPSSQRAGAPVPWITIGDLPETPDQVICLTPYDATPPSAGSDRLVPVQVRTRGDRLPATAVDLQDAVYEVLHGRRRTLLGTMPNQIMVVQILRRNAAQLGKDELGRWQWVSTYDVSVNRVTANLTPDA
jgi:hypothetical protein